MTNLQSSGKLWMWGITTTLIICGGFFVGLAIWAFQSDVELVYDNYYDKDVVFEQQIRRVERTQALAIKPEMDYDQQAQLLTLRFPGAMNQPAPHGTLLLFRPSDLHLDREFPLDLAGDTLQTIPLPELLPGLWRIKLNWTSGNLEYYQEKVLVVNPKS